MSTAWRARVFAHPLTGSLWRGLPQGARRRLRPLLGLPEPPAPEPPAPMPPPAAGAAPAEPRPAHVLPEVATIEEMRAIIARIVEGAATGSEGAYRDLLSVQLRPPPICARMRATDPFSPEYAAMAMELAGELRGRPAYDAQQDERLGHGMQDRDLWTGLSPWDFRSPDLLAEFFDCYAAMLRQLGAPPGAQVLEYGPGSGQFLLALARLGYRCHAVDIEPEYLRLIRRQAEAMGLRIRCQRGVFGEGFGEQRFDAIVFFEAFHHAADFMGLLRRLRRRLRPGGRLILCGEPVFPPGLTDGPIPYPWGPRLDAISIQALQRGWMELGFQADFLLEALRRTGWHATPVNHPTTFRANMIVCTLAGEPDDAA
ncbi:MAG: class I SAM-dependent methyltransferase [Rubritepida sp.]|jgi:SAM-dependent methyltransferase|nr:class I SAM-dependent methyltransferase [Rubritepida sp.]